MHLISSKTFPTDKPGKFVEIEFYDTHPETPEDDDRIPNRWLLRVSLDTRGWKDFEFATVTEMIQYCSTEILKQPHKHR